MKLSTDARSMLRSAGVAAAVPVLALALSACGALTRKSESPAPPSATPAESAAPIDKGDPNARFDAAMKLWRDNQIAEAEEAFISLTRDFPDHAGPWVNLGILFAKSNRRDPAIGAFGRAVSLNPDNKVAFNWLGILYREAGDLNRARLSYERALQIDADYALAHFNYGVLLDAHLKRPADALPHYRAYQRAGHADDLRVLAWIAEIEAAAKPAAPAPAPPAPGTAPKTERQP
ncbi:tetratricopeptide repeat protein [Fontimonas sp. SYSU GA230001]|uniref:tetratricopeptide repeat protein n=1 Tax=Fontimonas sp. SYSU GA230001 TaxID=3142450 RepID=UPI0032B4CA52